MNLLILDDKRINAKNVLIEMKISDYLELAKEIYETNEYQRSRVKSSSTVYSLLKDDLKIGCIIPPIVLALSNISAITFESAEAVLEHLKVNKKHLLILDGLQRTYQMMALEKEFKDANDETALDSFYKLKIRTEIYFGINKLGILYRMLTLNTGQTPMSLRHQVEILYSDYLKKTIEGITLLREVDDTRPAVIGEYKFKDVIDGFKSYMERNELPIERLDLLENIKGLEKLSKENQESDLFKDFINSYNKFVRKVNTISNCWEYNNKENPERLTGQAFGKDVLKIFNKSMSLAGYGAAIGKLKDYDLINSFEEVERLVENIKFNNVEKALANLLKILDDIRVRAPKIGNAQRMYFQYFFRELFNSKGDSFLVIDNAIDNAYQKYLSQTA